MACWREVLFAPGAAKTLMVFTLPTRPSSVCAVGRLNAASVAPARLLAVPNLAIPVMVKVCGGPGRRMRTRSPTAKWYFCAVPGVHHDVTRCRGRLSFDQVKGGELRVGIERQARRRCAAGTDGVAITGDELGVAADRTIGVGHPGNPKDSGEDRLGDRIPDGIAAAVEGGVASDFEVDVLVDVADQGRERVMQGVSEDQAPRDERDPQDDGEGGEGQPEFVSQ